MPSADRDREVSSNSPGSSLTRTISLSREPLRITEDFGSFGQACKGGPSSLRLLGLMTSPSCSPSEWTSKSPFCVIAPRLILLRSERFCSQICRGCESRQQQRASYWVLICHRRLLSTLLTTFDLDL